MSDAADVDTPSLAVVLQQLADWLAHERELGRERMRALGLDAREIDAVLAYGKKMHSEQIAWAESVALQSVGLVKLQ